MSSDLLMYQPMSPNFETPGCMVTGDMGDGIAFKNVLSLSGETLFIGRQAITEAFGELHDLTPAKLKKLLKLAEENKELLAQIEDQKRELAKFEDFKARMEDAGLAYRELV